MTPLPCVVIVLVDSPLDRIKPAMPYTSHSDEGGHSSSYSGAAESSRASVSGGGLGGGGGGGGGNARAHPEKQVKSKCCQRLY